MGKRMALSSGMAAAAAAAQPPEGRAPEGA
eukprot:COSAG01_NODE_4134_length_5316_cov_6.930255_4_plen_30_part_00